MESFVDRLNTVAGRGVVGLSFMAMDTQEGNAPLGAVVKLSDGCVVFLPFIDHVELNDENGITRWWARNSPGLKAFLEAQGSH